MEVEVEPDSQPPLETSPPPPLDSHVPFIPSKFESSNNFLSWLSTQPNYVDIFAASAPAGSAKFLYLRRKNIDSAYTLEIVSHKTITEASLKLKVAEAALIATLANGGGGRKNQEKIKGKVPSKKNKPDGGSVEEEVLARNKMMANYIILSQKGLTFNEDGGGETEFISLKVRLN